MANFHYKGRASGGREIEGVLEAASTDAVASQLISSGITPVQINEQAEATPSGLDDLKRLLTERDPTIDDLILLTRQIYTLMKAGVPINQAMTGLVRSTRNTVLVRVLGEIQVDLESGREFSTGLARHPTIFSPLFINTVRIGETTGRLDESLLKLSDYLELERETRARIKSALRYPMFVVIAIAIAMFIMNIVVIPEFAKVFNRAGVELPLPTQILIGTSNFFVEYWMHMIAAIILTVFWVRSYVATTAGRLRWDRIKLRLPIVGSILYRATLGRFARSFAVSLSAGVPLVQALSVVSRAVDNEHVGARIAEMRVSIERGDSLTRSATQTEMFSPLVLQMLAVGEETGAVDDLLDEVAGDYEREVDYDIKNLSQAIEPILIIVIAAMVLVLALGVFLPMWDMASVKMRR